MMFSPREVSALQETTDLEPPLAAVEAHLMALGLALRDRDPAAIDVEAAELHRCLATAVEHFGRAARSGQVPVSLRQRLAVASGQVAAHREALARATASLDRAIDVLLPTHAASVYGASGAADRPPSAGEMHA